MAGNGRRETGGGKRVAGNGAGNGRRETGGGKRVAGKGSSSSKGKVSASIEDDDDDFM